ncbi:CGNR zinc finger domain-containing protein [Longispora albida]|uniref:CGNR zinc finger domain-containing protein n=1 Tax=Longispora albida TaxID=203523 RepID=UPI00035C3F4B|nr:CGNR zinc finger domain-containing protein [Longispora albida]
MRYEDYIGNLARLAVELVNADEPSELSAELFAEHGVTRPSEADLAPLLAELRPAITAVVTGGALDVVNELLAKYPPQLHISDHDGPGTAHLHHAYNGIDGVSWIARSSAAALAHIACQIPGVIIGGCQADGCPKFFVDQSRNHSRRFCGNTCASRTTVAAYRKRTKGS